MKITYIITGLGLGGAEVITINIANKMVEQGHSVLVLYLTGENAHTERIDPRIEVVGLQMKKTPWGLVETLNRTRKVLEKFRPDVVHSQMIHANLFARLLRIGYKFPLLICTEHSFDIQGKWRMLAYRLTDFLSDKNTNVSIESTEKFIRAKAFSRRKSLAIYNGIDIGAIKRNEQQGLAIRKQFGVDAAEFLWLHVGRFNAAKDHHNLLEALATVHLGRLMLLGKGELQPEIEQTIERLGLSDRVVLAGAHSNVGDFYAAANCLVLSSAWEGLPMVVLEAMAYGLPVISTTAGAPQETIADYRWIVPTKDPQALAAKMLDMIDLSSEDRNEIGLSNQNKVAAFDLNVICNRWLALYQAKD